MKEYIRFGEIPATMYMLISPSKYCSYRLCNVTHVCLVGLYGNRTLY